MIVISQRDGTGRRFPRSAGMEAFVNLMDRMGSGEDAPPEQPLIAVADSGGWELLGARVVAVVLRDQQRGLDGPDRGPFGVTEEAPS